MKSGNTLAADCYQLRCTCPRFRGPQTRCAAQSRRQRADGPAGRGRIDRRGCEQGGCFEESRILGGGGGGANAGGLLVGRQAPGIDSAASAAPPRAAAPLWNRSWELESPPSSVVVNTQGRESRGSGFEACSGVRYPGGALVVWPLTSWLIQLNGESPSFERLSFNWRALHHLRLPW